MRNESLTSSALSPHPGGLRGTRLPSTVPSKLTARAFILKSDRAAALAAVGGRLVPPPARRVLLISSVGRDAADKIHGPVHRAEHGAPAPSPNKHARLAVSISTYCVRISPPMTTACFDWQSDHRVGERHTIHKAEHAATMSIAAALFAPEFCLEVKQPSTEEFDRRYRGAQNQIDVRMLKPPRARLASGRTAKSEVYSPGAALRRCLMPVRLIIQSSDVSTIFSKSALVRMPSV